MIKLGLNDQNQTKLTDSEERKNNDYITRFVL
jgi:hypothetical protein